MDNICHTLVGLALGEAGLGRRTARGTATLAVAANLPDVDALAYLAGGGVTGLVVRRGWTHGVVAMVVLPVALAALVWAWDGMSRRRERRRNRFSAADAGPPAELGPLFALATVGVLSHAFMDWLNTYGVRLLMPFGDTWFYGDALFIVDPWLWLALAAGALLAARRRRAGVRGRVGARGRRDVAHETRPARVAVIASAAYVVAMIVTAAAAERLAERAARARGAAAARRVMAGPVALTPFRREVVRDLGGAYEIAPSTGSPPPATPPRPPSPRGSARRRPRRRRAPTTAARSCRGPASRSSRPTPPRLTGRASPTPATPAAPAPAGHL
jgi:inner membrane protein